MRTRWARGLAGTGVFVLVLVLVAMSLAPGIIHDRLEARLQERLGPAAQVGEIELHYLSLALTIHEISLESGRVGVDIDAAEIDWPLRALVRSDVRPAVVLHRPRVVYTTDREPKPKDDQPTRLDLFDSLQIIDGSVQMEVTTPSGATVAGMTEIEAMLTNPQFGSSQMGTRLNLEAELPGEGHLRLEGQVSSTQPRLAWRLRFDLRRLKLSDFNNLWMDIVEMDVESGSLSVRGELLRTTAHLRGRITPRFDGLVLLDPNEDARHPMGEALLEHMLVGATATIDVNQDLEAGSTLTFNKLLATDWRMLVAALIKRGYSRRLDTLDGYEAEIGDVEIDFGMGLLTLYEVQLINESLAVDVPFVSVPRIDVMFDRQVTERGAKAYKHVTLWEPTVTFVAARKGSESQIRFDERWVDKISALPFKTRDLIVHDGRVEFRDHRHAEPVHFFVSDIELVGAEMAADLHAPGFRGARLSGSCKLMGVGHATIAVAFEPRAPLPNLDLDLFLPPLSLEVLNPVLRTYAEVEADAGALGFSAHISARNLHAEASVVPTVVGPKLHSVEYARKKFRHVMIERRLKRLRGRAVDVEFEMEPGEGVLHEFFPAFLVAALRER